MRQIVYLGGLSLMLMCQSLWADSADDILGLWHTDKKKSTVEIYACQDNRYCGKIIELKDPLFTYADGEAYAGKPKTDLKNPDEQLRERPIIGLSLLQGFEYKGSGRWGGGTIYDPESGKTYQCKLTLKSKGRLKVRGFVGISLLGRTTTWNRP